MYYENVLVGEFIERPNRFIAHVRVGDEIVISHVKNTGRCKELLVPKAKVILQKAKNPNRKTKYDLISVYKGERLINMDSQAPNDVVDEFLNTDNLFKDIKVIKREKKYKDSRFDFYIETGDEKIFIEVKGVTLEEEGVVRFPDAPTLRGIKHVKELGDSLRAGYKACIIFVVQMEGVKYFEPNYKTHPEFGEALKKGKEEGIDILAFECEVKENEMFITKKVEVKL